MQVVGAFELLLELLLHVGRLQYSSNTYFYVIGTWYAYIVSSGTCGLCTKVYMLKVALVMLFCTQKHSKVHSNACRRVVMHL